VSAGDGPVVVPRVTGTPDRVYLDAALRRAGRTVHVCALAEEPFTDGRSGTRVVRLRARAGDGTEHTFVLKMLAAGSLFRDALLALGERPFTEVELFRSGALSRLPPPLACPTIEVARHEERDEWWILMDDVSAGVVPRGAFDEEQARALLGGLARLHARYWGRTEELAAIPLGHLDTFTAMVAEPLVARGRGRTPADGWLRRLADEFVLGRFLPVLLEVLGPEDADFYLRLAEDRAPWLRVIARHPFTFLHGDIRRANVAFLDGRVMMFDWEAAMRGPAALDLQWWWMLQFWAYPPADGLGPDDREPLRAYYLAKLEEALAPAPLDRADFQRAWEVCWIRALVTVGVCIVDPLLEPGHGAEDIARAKHAAREAVARARRAHDAHVR
jgi:prepilin-type processing-associated H-X9-DG protein